MPRKNQIIRQYDLDQWGKGDPSLWFRGNPTRKFTRTENQRIVWKDRSSGFVSWSNQSRTLSTVEELYSFNNAFFWRYLKSKDGDFESRKRIDNVARFWLTQRDVGGNFLKTTDSMKAIKIANISTGNYDGQNAIVGIMQEGQTGKPPRLATSATPVGVLNAFGTSAISKVSPTAPNASLAVFLGELREGLPSIPLLNTYKDRTRSIRQNAGSEYLNVEFGWKPMISDLRAFGTSIKKNKQIWEQFVKNSDRDIRRRYHAPTVRVTNSYDCQFLTGSNRTGYTLYSGKCVDEISTDMWFSGAFRYHVPNGNSALDTLKRFEQYSNVLFGARITPEVLWNLAPWSWMLDWFGNLGDIISNLSMIGQDGLVLRYGYVMEHRKVVRNMYSTAQNGQPLHTRRIFESKRRIVATPYGFGLDLDSLSAKQIAILAALGLSFGKKKR